MDQKDYLSKLRNILTKNNEDISDLEMTSGNYDDNGNLIKEDVSTLTTRFCEIGVYQNNIYFVFIIQSDNYTEKLFESLKSFSNIQFYGFKDFKNNLYPKDNFSYQEFEKEIKKDKYLQIQFNYQISKMLPELLFGEYNKIRNILNNNKVEVINQIKDKI